MFFCLLCTYCTGTGILRGVFANTKSGPKNNKMPYVFTNPPKDTELFTCDKVFILSQTNMTHTRVVKDETKEMQMYSNLRSRKKTAEDIIHMVSSSIHCITTS